MIDLLIVKGIVGPPQPWHRACLAEVTFSRFFTSKTKPTVTFIESPVTGSQIEALYRVETLAGQQVATVEIKLPVASATIGQNFIHAGLDALYWERKCAALLTRITLIALGFSRAERNRFRSTLETQLLELTWHTPTASIRARLNLQKRTSEVFETFKETSRRHDVQVKDVDCRRKNGCPCLLVGFKNGDEFRQYGKYDQVAAKSNKGKHRYQLSSEMKQHRVSLLAKIETHARNEVRLGHETLKKHGLLNPKSWTPEAIEAAIASFWKNAGLAGAEEADSPSRRGELSSEVQNTWNRFEAGESVSDILPSYTLTRHRKQILAASGPDIVRDLGRKGAAKPDSVGYQLRFDRRRKPDPEDRELIVCADTGPALALDLERGLKYIVAGVIPDIEDSDELASWLKRWQAFAEREHIRKPKGDADE